MDALVPIIITLLVLSGLAYFAWYHWPRPGMNCHQCGKPLGDRTKWVAGLTEYRCADCKPSGRVDNVARNIYQIGEENNE